MLIFRADYNLFIFSFIQWVDRTQFSLNSDTWLPVSSLTSLNRKVTEFLPSDVRQRDGWKTPRWAGLRWLADWRRICKHHTLLSLTLKSCTLKAEPPTNRNADEAPSKPQEIRASWCFSYFSELKHGLITNNQGKKWNIRQFLTSLKHRLKGVL